MINVNSHIVLEICHEYEIAIPECKIQTRQFFSGSSVFHLYRTIRIPSKLNSGNMYFLDALKIFVDFQETAIHFDAARPTQRHPFQRRTASSSQI